MRARGLGWSGLFGALALLAACLQAPAASLAAPAEQSRPAEGLEAELRSHIAKLASDRFGGREPGTAGETLTLDYLQDQFAKAGVQSGTHDPSHPWREPFVFARDDEVIHTHNLIARLPGREPQSGAVLLVAHWDHLGMAGRCRRKNGDAICNGAVDNAAGLAMMIEIARALAKGPRLRRDIYFLASGAEEDGLKGATAFVMDPPVPIEKFVAVFNLDTEGLAPRGAPAVVLATPDPPGVDGLMSMIASTARDKGIVLVAPTATNAKFLQRQDAWVFDGVGVPAAIVSAAFADEPRLQAYMKHRYHRPSDQVDGVELGATAEMVAFHVALLRRAADPEFLPRSASVELTATAH